MPLRIANDFEERNIILEDLKADLGLGRIDEAQNLFDQMSADWESLVADQDGWQTRAPNAPFIGAWHQHRAIYGYMLRSELVYQLKKALEQHPDFRIEGPLTHLLVDEYQDLNKCDLAVIKAIRDRGVNLFVAGDDDQSIYGFRKAHPAGIRNFITENPGAGDLRLRTCMRCDPNILALAHFIANQDVHRERKDLVAELGKTGGEVVILSFREQKAEAQAIASLVVHLINNIRILPHEILILLRSDSRGAFSSVIHEALMQSGIEVAMQERDAERYSYGSSKKVLSVLQLIVNEYDHLAWRCLLQWDRNGVGSASIQKVHELATSRGLGFAQGVNAVHADPACIGAAYGNRIRRVSENIQALIMPLRRTVDLVADTSAPALTDILRTVVESIVVDPAERAQVLAELLAVVDQSNVTTVGGLLEAIAVSNANMEPVLVPGKVSILTMHRAKGLTADAAIIAAAEDQYIPGRATGESIDDERRLFYVSLTRARHALYMTYCGHRWGQQERTGRTAGDQRRSLTGFLGDGPIIPISGRTYMERLARDVDVQK
jgi:DNA helicase-2/ATP-dependent DNA helicase PcrA